MRDRWCGPNRRGTVLLAVAALTALAVTAAPGAAVAATDAPAGEYAGTIDGAAYLVKVPEHWNGTLLLFSHGYLPPGADNPAVVAPVPAPGVTEPRLETLLLDRGYALAGSAYSRTGWAVREALHDQIALLGQIPQIIGAQPRSTISWGASTGGLIAVLLAERNPDRFDGVLSLGGVLAGSGIDLAADLDFAYAIKLLLAPDSGLLLAGITDGPTNQIAAINAIMDAGSGTPAQQARLALATSLVNIPAQLDAHASTALTDLDQAIPALAEMALYRTFLAFGRGRVDIEARAGGNPVGNVTADYRQVFARSSQRGVVEAAYERAGLDLSADLDRLNAGTRVAADPAAAGYLTAYGTPVGYLPVPTLTVHNTLDATAAVEEERFLSDQASLLGRTDRLRQVYIGRAGHASLSPAETVVALDALLARVHTGSWPDTSPAALNQAAAAFPDTDRLVYSDYPAPGTDNMISMPPGFAGYSPAPMPRLLPL